MVLNTPSLFRYWPKLTHLPLLLRHWFNSSHFADCEPRSKGLKIIYQIDKSFSKSVECRLMHFNHLHFSKKQITGVLVFLFTVFGIQSSYADYYPSGIQQNVPEQTLIDITKCPLFFTNIAAFKPRIRA